jgi:hypothetical protein
VVLGTLLAADPLLAADGPAEGPADGPAEGPADAESLPVGATPGPLAAAAGNADTSEEMVG